MDMDVRALTDFIDHGLHQGFMEVECEVDASKQAVQPYALYSHTP